MGWRDWIKTFVKGDKDQQVADEARGVSVGAAPTQPGTPWGTVSEGYNTLSEALSIDTELMYRYADYENMDDYVETCLAGDSLVFTVERGWVQIQELAETQEDFHVLAYDQDLKSLVPAKACDARMTGKPGHEKPMVRVLLDDGRAIRCTADHLFMKRDGSWVAAENILCGDFLMPDSEESVRHVVSIDPIECGEAVYDLTVPGYENFVCNGVVVHNSAALDYYADDSTIPDSIHGKTIWELSRDSVVRDIIDDCMHRRLRIEEDIWLAVRTLCKYGNCFAEILVNEVGVVGLNWLPVPTMRRVVDEKGSLIGFVQDVSGSFNFQYSTVIGHLKKGTLPPVEEDPGRQKLIFFHPWQVVHWRLRSKMMRGQYGHSVLDSARWIWKRLVLMEDTALVQKLTRSPGRFAFYVDTGDLPPKEAMALVKKVKRGYKKIKLIDPSTGKLDFRYNPLSPTDDFWIPTRGGKESTRIETISGPDVQMMDDVQYFQGKLVTAVKVPRGYLGLEEGGAETDKSLAAADVRFARACMRVQREFIMGMRKIIRIHMAALNIDPDSIEWKIRMTVPSAIFEMQQIEVMNAQAALADSMTEWASKTWILQHVFHFTEDDSAFISREKEDEMDANMKKEAATQADIMRLYPELQDMPQPDEGGAPTGESDMSGELAGLKKVLQEASQTLPEVVKRFERLEKRMGGLEKTIRRQAISG